MPDVHTRFAWVSPYSWHVRVYFHGALVLQKVPVLHKSWNGQAFLQGFPHHIVGLDDLLQCTHHLVKFCQPTVQSSSDHLIQQYGVRATWPAFMCCRSERYQGRNARNLMHSGKFMSCLNACIKDCMDALLSHKSARTIMNAKTQCASLDMQQGCTTWLL